MVDVAVITDAGRAELTKNKANGLQIGITGAVFGSTLLSSDPTVIAPYTAVPNSVYTCDSSYITYASAGQDKIVFTVRLGSTIGDFPVGCWGLLSDKGTLVTLTALAQIENKYKSQPTIAGNIRFYQIIVDVSSMSNILNLSLLVSSDASLPEVGNENLLPAPNDSVYPVYYVDKWLGYKSQPALASRLNGSWYFYPCFNDSRPALFDSSTVPGNAVYFSQSLGKFQNSIANDINKFPVGIVGPNYTLVGLGDIYTSPTNGIYTEGITYYVDTANPGKLSANFCFSKVGISLSDNSMLVHGTPLLGPTVGRILDIVGDAGGAIINIYRPDAPVDEKRWAINTDMPNHKITYSAYNDANNTSADYMTVYRNGFKITGIQLQAAPNYFSVDQTTVGLYTSVSHLTLTATKAEIGLPSSTLDITENARVYNNAMFQETFNSTVYQLYSYNYTVTMNYNGWSSADRSGNGFYLNKNSNSASSSDIGIFADLIVLGNRNIISKPYILAQSDLYVTHYSNGSAINYADGVNFLTNTARVVSTADFLYGGYGYRTTSAATPTAADNTYIQRFPNGFKIIYGTGNCSSGRLDYFPFPESFNSFFKVVACEADATGWDSANSTVSPTVYGIAAYGLGGFLISASQISPNGTTRYLNGAGFNYIAMGV